MHYKYSIYKDLSWSDPLLVDPEEVPGDDVELRCFGVARGRRPSIQVGEFEPHGFVPRGPLVTEIDNGDSPSGFHARPEACQVLLAFRNVVECIADQRHVEGGGFQARRILRGKHGRYIRDRCVPGGLLNMLQKLRVDVDGKYMTARLDSLGQRACKQA